MEYSRRRRLHRTRDRRLSHSASARPAVTSSLSAALTPTNHWRRSPWCPPCDAVSLVVPGSPALQAFAVSAVHQLSSEFYNMKAQTRSALNVLVLRVICQYILPLMLGLQCFVAVVWAAGRASGPQKCSGEVLAWLAVWSEVQMICIWSSWCHCHPLISCSSKIQNDLPFWCWLTQDVLEKRPLNGCSAV